MAASFGVHFGTTNVCLALYRDGRTDVVANDAGDRVTPAVVAFVNGEKAVGLAAKQDMSRNASSTVTHVKQLIGKKEVSKSFLNEKGCKIIRDSELKYQVENDGKLEYYTPVEVMEVIFKKMLCIAQSYIHEENLYSAVITVPFHFTDEQKTVVRDAATKAGFTVLRIISEPSAAALAYKLGQKSKDDPPCNVVIYRVGGASLDATVLQVSSGLYHIAGSIHRTCMGGNNLTQALVDHCVQEFHRQYKLDITESRRSVFKLWHGAEICKHSLSTMNSAQCFAESVHEGVDFNMNITRARFESLINSQLQQFLEPLSEVIQKSGVSKENVHKVILCGGSTKLPRLQQLLRDRFPNAELLNQISCDEVIAIGAAEQAAILVGNKTLEIEETLLDTLSKGIFLKTLDLEGKELLEPVISSGTPIPVKTVLKFTLPDSQEDFVINIYESSGPINDDDISEVDLLARVAMRDLCTPAEVNVAFHVKSDGSMHVTCTEKTSGRSESIIIECEEKS